MTDKQWEPPEAIKQEVALALHKNATDVALGSMERTWRDHARAALLASPLPECVAVLREIAEGKGAYSRDRLEHAANCINEMKALAKGMLAKLESQERADA